MNAGGAGGVSAAMPSPDPKTEAAVERMYAAMRAVINAAPMVAFGLALGACAGLTDEAEHAPSIVRLLTLGRLFPETAPAVQRLVDLVIGDKLEPVRQALVKR